MSRIGLILFVNVVLSETIAKIRLKNCEEVNNKHVKLYLVDHWDKGFVGKFLFDESVLEENPDQIFLIKLTKIPCAKATIRTWNADMNINPDEVAIIFSDFTAKFSILVEANACTFPKGMSGYDSLFGAEFLQCPSKYQIFVDDS